MIIFLICIQLVDILRINIFVDSFQETNWGHHLELTLSLANKQNTCHMQIRTLGVSHSHFSASVMENIQVD
jgi:hypothetical protein